MRKVRKVKNSSKVVFLLKINDMDVGGGVEEQGDIIYRVTLSS